MSLIQFSHANGFPAKTYSILFKYLKEFEISYVEILAKNVKPEEINWYDMSEEIIYSAEKYEKPLVGIGHSLGGILTLLAASKKPDIFHSVILLDPPMFSPMKRGLINFIQAIKLYDYFSPAGKSKKRRKKFDSMHQALEYFKNKNLFKNFHPEALKDYVKYSLFERGNGVELKISVEKEVAIYRNILTKYPNSLYNVKGVIAYGAKNPILWKSDINWIKRKFTKFKVIVFPGTHFFPLENPESTALFIKRHL